MKTLQMETVRSSMTENPSGIDASFRRNQWRMLIATMFCYLFFYTGRQTFGFAIPGIQAEFGTTKETLGWINAAMLWCYAIGQTVNGNLSDVLGGRRVMSVGAILSCVMNWAASFATGALSLGIIWGCNGCFQSMGWAPGSRLLSNWWGRHERGKVFGWYVFAAGMASVLSYVTSLVVIGTFHLNWRWIFRIPVLLLLVGGITFYLVVREKPEDLGFASPHSEETASSDDIDTETATETSLQRYKAVLTNWRLLIGGISIGFQSAARYGLIVWVPVYFLSVYKPHADVDPRWVTLALPIGMAIGAITNGWISDRWFSKRRCLAIVIYMGLAALTALWMHSIPSTHFYEGLCALFLCGFFVYGPQASFWALCPDIVGSKRAGTAVGVMNFFAYLFAGLGEPYIGAFMDKHQDTSFIFIIVAAASAVSAVVASFIRR